MDNFYNSVELSESLITDKVRTSSVVFLFFFLEYQEYKMSIFEICFILYHTVRTLRKNSGECKDIRNAGNKENKLRKGDALAKDNGKVMTICWMDKKPVLALSTY